MRRKASHSQQSIWIPSWTDRKLDTIRP
jgi:hypothetical protein